MSKQDDKETKIPDLPEEEPTAEANAGEASEAKAEGATTDEELTDVPAEEAEEETKLEDLSEEQAKEILQRAAEAELFKDKWVRLTADFENFKKRTARDRQDAIRYANEALLERLLPVMDNFEMALKAMNNDDAAAIDSLKMGVNMISTQLKGVLTDSGMEEIDGLGKDFDPNVHEALEQRETADAPEGQVIEQLRKGYKLKDRLVRPASVVVAKTPGSGAEAEEASDAEAKTDAAETEA